MVDAGRILIRGLVIIAAVGMLAMGCSAGGTALKDGATTDLAKIQNIDVKEAGDVTKVQLSLDRPVTFTTVKLSDPPMMVMDLAGVELGKNINRIDVGKDPVLYIKPQQNAGSSRIARLEIGLSRPVATNITQDGSLISILFDKSAAKEAKDEAPMIAPASGSADTAKTAADVSDAAAAASAPGPEPVHTADAGQNAKAEAPKEPAVTVVSATDVKKTAALPDARTLGKISVAKSGKTVNLTLEGDGRIAHHKEFMVGKDRLVIDVYGVGSAKDKDTIKVGGKCVKQIRMASHTVPEEKVRVVLDLGCAVDYDVKSEGSGLAVAVAPRGSLVVASVKAAPAKPVADIHPATASAAPAQANAGAKQDDAAKAGSQPSTAKAVVTAATRKVTVSVPPADSAAEQAPKIYISQKDGKTVLSNAPEDVAKVVGSDKDVVVTPTKIYTGGKISFDIQDADLDKVIKLLADVAGLNLIMNPGEVKGKVTLKLTNVPWDQALDILLRIYNLDKVIEGNVLRVAPKKKLAEERKMDLQAIAEQKRLMEEAEDLYTKTFKINFANASELEGKVKKILSKRGEATANPRTNELIVTDVRDKIVEAGQLINILDKEVNQILIEARIVTVTVGYTQSLGISWGLKKYSNTTNPQIGIASGSTESLAVGADGANGSHSYALALPTELGKAAAGLVGGFTWGSLLKDVNVDLTISALEAINKAETLAAPKVMTLENNKAEITQGTTLYVQTTSASGTKPEPLNANLSLTVTPRVTGDNYITMEVDATNNSPSTPPPGSTAAIDTQAVKTNIIVKDGETIVLGGIYTKKKGKGDSQVPWLGKIPILGWLFKERNTNEDTSELLIFITPKLMKQQQPVVVRS